MNDTPVISTPRFLIERLTDAAMLQYLPRYRLAVQIPINGKSWLIGSASGTVIHLAQIAHDYTGDALAAAKEPDLKGHARYERLLMLGKRRLDMMFLAGSLAREYNPVFRKANLHVSRTGEVVITADSTDWMPKSEHPTSSWASSLMEIFNGTSKIPAKTTIEKPAQETGKFCIIPNDPRIVQLNTLMKTIYERLMRDNDVNGGTADIDCVPLGCRVYGCLTSIMQELILHTGLIPLDADITSIGFNDGFITGQLVEPDSKELES
jgi:hypothetical protein